MKTLCTILAIGFVVTVSAVRGDEPPPEKEQGLSIDVGGGVHVRLGKSRNGSKGVHVDAPGVRVNVGNSADGSKGIHVDAPGVRVGVGKADNGAGGIHVDAPGVRVRLGAEAGDGHSAADEKETYLGLFAEPISEALAAQLGDLVGKGAGLLVTQVLPESPAEKAGIKPHDVLAAYDGKPLTSTEQLKALVRADKPGRTVKFELVRASKKRAVGVVVAERDVAGSPALLDEDPRISVHFFGRQMIVGRHGLDAPGAVIRWGTPAEVDASQGRPTACSVMIDRRDGNTWTVRATHSGPDGKENERQWEGTSAEIRARLDEVPPTVGDQVRRSLDRAEAEKAVGKNVKVNVQPRVQGTDRAVHVSILRPGRAGGPRIFEFDYVFGGEQTVKINDLLQIKALAGELHELAPSVREQVETTLRNIEIPEVRVAVRNSL